MKMRERHPDLVKIERQRPLGVRDGQHAVGWMFELSGVGVDLVRGPRAGNAAAARLCPCRLARFLVLQPDGVLPLGPRRERQAEQPLVHVVRDDVVERRCVVPDDEHDDADGIVRHRGDLRVKSREIAAVIRDEVSAVRRGPAAHAVRGVQDLAPPAYFQAGIRERDGWRKRLLDGRFRQDLPAVEHPVVHERDEPPGHVHDVRVDRAGRRHPDRVAVVRDLVQLGAVAPLGVGNAGLRCLEHVVDRERRAHHAERRQDAIANEALPRLARKQLDRIAGARVHHVVVEKHGTRCL